MAALTDDVKRFVVQALACYDTPSQVAEAVKEEFGLVVQRQQVATYDPTKHAGKNLSAKWRVVFDATREKFKDEVSDIPIAQRAYRLRVLQRIASKAEGMRNLPLTAQLLEQAAKEVGDAYVNRQKTDGKEGADVPQPTQVVITVQDARKNDGDG
ncbi:MAG TPA: DUF2280 domain-containing protein [Pseudorhodoferax sp.]|nr:DUF2280 domain-containing protein [Pseudorhodoferax sp.]